MIENRSGYSEDCYGWSLICWRGAVNKAIKGARGQKLLRDLAAAMDVMPVKELIAGDLVASGGYCALGVVGAARGVNMATISPENHTKVSQALDIARALAKEIAFINDDDFSYEPETPARRWTRVRKWVSENIIELKP